MTISRRAALSIAALSTVSILTFQAPVIAVDKTPPGTVSVGLFEAMDAGQIDVKIIPRNATEANVLFKNLIDKPIELRLPKAFASVPILAQGIGGGGGGRGGGGQGGGGGFGGGGGGGGRGGGGGGFGGGGGGGNFRIGPERMKKIKVATVCLEHGKPDPNPKMAYKIVPLENFTDDVKIRVLCEALADGQVAQNTAQAAAWHIMDKMSWEELASKNRVENSYTGNVKWFSPIELRSAMAVVREVTRIAKVRTTDTGSGETDSGDQESLSGSPNDTVATRTSRNES